MSWFGYVVGILLSFLMVFASLSVMINMLGTIYFNIGLLGNIIFSWALVEILLYHPKVNSKKQKCRKDNKGVKDE